MVETKSMQSLQPDIGEELGEIQVLDEDTMLSITS